MEHEPTQSPDPAVKLEISIETLALLGETQPEGPVQASISIPLCCP